MQEIRHYTSEHFYYMTFLYKCRQTEAEENNTTLGSTGSDTEHAQCEGVGDTKH
jgi:hypothetical protein